MRSAFSVIAWISISGLATLPGQTIHLVPTKASPITTVVNTTGYTYGVAVGDFNQDGKLDVALVTDGSPTYHQVVVVLLGNGDGTFQPGVQYSVGKTSSMVVAASLRNSRTAGPQASILDLVVPNFQGGDLSILLGNGDGTFQSAKSVVLGPTGIGGTNPNFVAAGDFNDDGNLDLAVTLGNATKLAVLLGNGDGTFKAPTNIELGHKAAWVGAAAFTGRLNTSKRPIVDLVTAISGSLLVLPGNGDGTFQAPQSVPTGVVGPAAGFPPDGAGAIGDLNGDGKMDVAIPDTAGGAVSVLLGNGDGTFQAFKSYPVGLSPAAVAIADFDGDGHPDLAVDNQAAEPMNLAVLRGKGDGTFEAAVNFDAGPKPQLMAAGDFNSDHKPDLVLANEVFPAGNASAAAGTILLNSSTTSAVPLHYVPVTPCRIADTRTGDGPFGGPSLAAQSIRDFAIPSSVCGIPSTAAAYSLNIAVVPHARLGYLTTWATGQPQPVVSTLNSLDGRIKSNAAIVPAGANGAISVFVTDATDVILDINGYFSAIMPQALEFYPLTPCHVADTRLHAGPLGGPSLAERSTRAFPILSSPCGVPSNAQAYSLNFAVVPRGPLGFLTAWPAGEAQPLVASLNALTGAITANAAIVPAGTNGAINVYVTNPTDLVIDINGYFALPGNGGLSLYAVPPCRVKDTRRPAGSPPVNGTFNVDVTASSCGTPGNAGAYVFGVTVVPHGPLEYLTMWPEGQPQPVVATLNAFDGALTSNMAIVPTENGSISVFVTSAADVIIDLTAYFAP